MILDIELNLQPRTRQHLTAISFLSLNYYTIKYHLLYQKLVIYPRTFNHELKSRSNGEIGGVSQFSGAKVNGAATAASQFDIEIELPRYRLEPVLPGAERLH